MVNYQVNDAEKWELTDDKGNVFELSGNDVVEISGDVENMELRKSTSVNIPTEFTLSQNYPNPFNPTTTISFSIPVETFDSNVSRRSGGTSLHVYDLTGRLVKTLLNDNIEPGYHSVVWSGTDTHGQSVASGMYLYQLKTDNNIITKKLVLLK